MNERIKELAKQAGFDVEETTGGGDVWFDEGWNTELVERFAELVRQDAMEEAATICDGLNYNGIDPLGCAAAIRNRAEGQT